MFEKAQIGDEFIYLLTGQVSTVINKTSTSIEMFNTADRKKVDKAGKLLGIDCSNWYEESWFKREYKTFDKVERKFEKLKEWLEKCIDKQKWSSFEYY